MSDVTFDEDTQPARPAVSRQPKGLFKLVIRLGLAEDEVQARKVLLGIAVVAVIIGIAYPLLIP